jgi:hypothetical protein
VKRTLADSGKLEASRATSASRYAVLRSTKHARSHAASMPASGSAIVPTPAPPVAPPAPLAPPAPPLLIPPAPPPGIGAPPAPPDGNALAPPLDIIGSPPAPAGSTGCIPPAPPNAVFSLGSAHALSAIAATIAKVPECMPWRAR